MTASHRPHSALERSQCLAAVGPLDDPSALHPVVAAVVAATFAPARADYEGRLAEVAAAEVAVLDTRKARNQSNTAFDGAFRKWEATVQDDAGKARPTDLAVALGGFVPSDFVKRRPAVKAHTITGAIAELAPRGLSGDAARLAALTGAAEALAAAVAAYDAAVRARKDAVQKLDAVLPVFDRAWTALADAIVRYDPDATAKLPVFFRSSGEPEAT